MNAPLPAIAEEDLARADAYAVLARVLYAPPDEALLSMLRNSPRSGEGPLAAAWNALCTAADDAHAIAEEYETLFVSIGKPMVPLYASWYLTGFLMEKPLAELRSDLARLGLARGDGETEAEDHMAGELDVMRHLIFTGGVGEIGEAEFFARHIRPWYGDLCAALTAVPGVRFYRATADFMRAFLDMERDYFALGGAK